MELKTRYLKYYKKYRSIISYIFFGVLTTLVNYATYFLFTRAVVLNENIANIIAWVLSVLFAFFTNKRWVFESKTDSLRAWLVQLRDFTGARLFSGIIDIGIVWLGVSVMGFAEGYQDLIVKALSGIVVIVLNYVLSKFMVFKKK